MNHSLLSFVLIASCACTLTCGSDNGTDQSDELTRVSRPYGPPSSAAPPRPPPRTKTFRVLGDDRHMTTSGDSLCPETLANASLGQYATTSDLHADTLIVAWKSSRLIGLYNRGRLNRSAGQPNCWKIALALGREQRRLYERKILRGDDRTPQGLYNVSDRPESQWYHALIIHYPNAVDAAIGYQNGVIDNTTRAAIETADEAGVLTPQSTALGSSILIHGGGSDYDWTAGCIAMNNGDIDTLRAKLEPSLRAQVLILK